jgi:hypothetical protein
MRRSSRSSRRPGRAPLQCPGFVPPRKAGNEYHEPPQTWRLLSDLAVHQLANDVKVAHVPCVLLQQVKQDALKCRGNGAVPPLARLPDVGQLAGLDHRAGDVRLDVQGLHEVSEALVRVDKPTAVSAVAPRLSNGRALKAPDDPATLDVDQVLQQCERCPTRGKPAYRSSSSVSPWSLSTTTERK